MSEKNQQEKQAKEKANAEKPVSLWGAPFQDVLKVLLQTKPASKSDKINREKKK